jgi:endonuclease YncB( thermonuclease family)
MAHCRPFLLVFTIAAVVIVVAGTPIVLAAAPAFDISGNTYTSPQFGYTVTWADNWVVVDETSDQFDRLHLTDGVTYAAVVGGRSFAGNAQVAAIVYSAGIRRQQGVSNFAPMLDGNGHPVRGGDATHAFSAVTFTFTFNDGSTADIDEFIEAFTLIPGQAVVILDAYTQAGLYDSERSVIDQLAAGITMPAPPAPKLIAGEAGPVYVTGPWRVAVAVAAQSDGLAAVGLKPKSGKAWLVVVADVTNWSDADAQFAVKEFGVRVGGSSSLNRLAVASTKAVAKKLALAPASSDLVVAIPAGKTERVAMVFQLPAGSEEPVLVHAKESLPLTDVLDSKIVPDNLPNLAGPPTVSKGKIVGVADGETLAVQLANKDKADTIRLLGVDAPAEGNCYAGEAKGYLAALQGASVLLEKDAAVTGGSAARYVWLVNRDGTRTLLNQQAIARGFAVFGTIPADARFAAWLGASSRAAEGTQAGMWTACAAKSTASANATATSTASGAPTTGGSPAASPVASPIASPRAKSS